MSCRAQRPRLLRGALALVGLVGCGRVDYAPDGGGPGLSNVDGTVPSIECTTRFVDALLCSGFEADEGPYWSLEANDGQVEILDGEAHGGVSALRAEVTSGGGSATAYRSFTPVGSGDLWVRMHVRVPTPGALRAINLLALEHEGSDVFGVDVNATSNGRFEVFLTEAGTFAPDPEVRAPVDVWACLELHVVPSNTDGTVELFVDEQLAVSATGIDSFPDGAYDRLRVGLDWTDRAQGRVYVFVDDVVVALARVGCD
jgi:hypothetical protein